MASGSMVADISIPASEADTINCSENSANNGCGAYNTKKIATEQSSKWMMGIALESFKF
ncbi:hypothetical protein PPEP_a3513 [Pseudoalteromonas peptidolytica F12-50-A1]|uniref:Uncharacterized protein n=1 Tax=Pseudoalteromonas peptidolytica F12-50-A1 TaxID=1315280 RepID=A0A8I0T3I8_9GAMM|nr:hypothetical protein [Pseudoalteromonas peptidolytica F12-50-A1]GEK11758.1 hypothetical protein PPE03_40070 [Pseudoalteromonas peptidolytica]